MADPNVVPAQIQSVNTKYPYYQPSFGENFALLANAYLQGREQRRLAQQEATQKLFAGVAPQWAAKDMIRPGGQMRFGDMDIPGMSLNPNPMPDVQDTHVALQTEALKRKMGLLPKEDMELYNDALEYATKDPQYAIVAAMGGFDPKTKKQQDLTALRDSIADKIFQTLKKRQDEVFKTGKKIKIRNKKTGEEMEVTEDEARKLGAI